MVYLLFLAILLIPQSSPVFSASLFNGSQALVFPANTTTACLAAFNTTLSCDPRLVQYLPRMEQYAQWNTDTKTTLCSAACGTSFQKLQTAVDSACSGQSFAWTSSYMTFSQVVEMYYYKFQLICLKDTITGAYCSDVESTWDIVKMNSTGTATWPNNTRKLYPDPNNDWFLSENNENSTLGFDVRTAADSSTIDGLLQPAIEDYYYNRSGPAEWDDTNYGWKNALEYDEYPLEIQCHNCFINRFVLGVESQFGIMYHEITAQYWKNWQLNCDLTTKITPANNITDAVKNYNHKIPVVTPSCPQNITIATLVRTTCNDLSLSHSIPLRGFVSLNSYSGAPRIDCNGLQNRTYCGPPSCPLSVVQEQMDAASYVKQFTNFTLPTFLGWNPSLRSALLLKNETVCVGPPGTAYTPSVISTIASPTVFTTTAKAAASTSVGTFASCGEYHVFQSGELCVQISLNYSITYIQFLSMNPLVNADCTNMVVGNDYCVFPVNGTQIATPTVLLPPAATANGTTTRCFSWHVATSTDSCALIAGEYGLTLAEFMLFNSGLNSACSNLVIGDAYCIDGTGSHSAGNATTVIAPAATLVGTTKPCYQWHTAVTGDSCDIIQAQYGISYDMIKLWNKVLATCSTGLVVGNAYCVDGTGKMATITSVIAPAATIKGVTSPCYQWHIVAAADTCSLLRDEYGVTTAAIEAWNPSMGTTCALPAAGDAICVDGAGRPSNATTVAAPAPTLQGTVTNCYLWYVVASGDNCALIQTKYNIYFALFQAWNPTLNTTCTNLQAGIAYCVQGTPISRISTTTTRVTTTTGTRATSTGTSLTAPGPTQTGITSQCTKYYLAVSGDTCAKIQTTYTITFGQFYAWNPAIGGSCTALLAGDAYCVAGPTVTSTGVTPPGPTQTGITSKCNKYYLTVTGDLCASIETKYSITFAQFYAWNPAIGSGCSALWVGEAYCVGVSA